ncbi:MAG: hypothetical protein IMZ66_01200 [Planctomycetes bacterium]|nr:hypothetical protein [Planctomycetota bacterium]
MKPARPCLTTAARLVALLAALVAAGAAGAGCGLTVPARLWADTALAGGEFSVAKRQAAYDGETVTFELECDPGAVHYVVFGVEDDETVVESGEVRGRYRWTRTFRTGPKPQTFEVHATPFLIRGKCDWVYDKAKDAWFFYPGTSEKSDIATASEQRIRITCYRREVCLRFTARDGPPASVELALVKPSGERTVVAPRPAGAPDARGFILLGPDGRGACEVVYTPDIGEVGRAGKTQAELLVTHADGSRQRLTQDIDTP